MEAVIRIPRFHKFFGPSGSLTICTDLDPTINKQKKKRAESGSVIFSQLKMLKKSCSNPISVCTVHLKYVNYRTYMG
jgi:hypothetical protein